MKVLPPPAFAAFSKAFPPMVGYAATCKVRSADPPMVGSRYVERTDWWKHIGSVPAPRVVVIQDIDDPPGTGAFLGKVHVNILMALGCVGAITNGAARELPGIGGQRLSGFRRPHRHLAGVYPRCGVWPAGGSGRAYRSTRRSDPWGSSWRVDGSARAGAEAPRRGAEDSGNEAAVDRIVQEARNHP